MPRTPCGRGGRRASRCRWTERQASFSRTSARSRRPRAAAPASPRSPAARASHAPTASCACARPPRRSASRSQCSGAIPPPGSPSGLRPRSVERAAAAAAGALLFATLFFSGGSSGDRIVWIGGAVIVLAAVGLVAACAGMLPLPRLDATAAAFVVALAALTAWAGTSLAWSIVPDRSWIGFNRTLVYVAFAVLGLLLGTLLRRAPTMVAAGLTVLLAAVVGWALLGKIFPALYAEPPASPITRLRNPIGYWNALALLADAAMPLALWIAAPLRRPHALRVTGVVLLYAAIVAVLLTYSRTGVVVGVAAVA